MIPDLPPWTDTSRIRLCPDCRRQPQAGERHGLLDGTTEDGEPLGFTCLDAADEMLLPPPTGSYSGPDPWSLGDPSEPPPF